MRGSERRGLPLRACLLALVTASLTAAGASAASAATFVVGTTSDDASGVAANCLPGAVAPCSLRDAITAANATSSPSSSPDEIRIPAGVYTSANTTLPEIDGNVNIRATDPGGAQTTTVNSGQTPKGTIQGSVLRIGDGDSFTPVVSISGLTISGGYSNDHEGGAGIVVNFGSTLTLTDSEVSHNRSSSDVFGGAGILNRGTLFMDRDAVVFNTADTDSRGAGITNTDHATIKDSTISDNVNTSSSTGSGFGGGIYNSSFAFLTLINDTIYANSGPGAGGLYVQPAESAATRLAAAMRLAAAESVAPAGVDIQNTILAFNQALQDIPPVLAAVRGALRAAQQSSSYVDCGGNTGSSALIDKGNNSDYDHANSCAFSAAKHDLVSIDPLLGALALYGGSTDNRLPKSGSPVIDAGANAGCPALDQRRLGRPAGASCEIGADEVQIAQTTTTATPTPQTGVLAAQAASPTVRITGVPRACVRRAFTVRVSIVSTIALTGDSFSIDGHARGVPRSSSFSVRIDAAALRSGHRRLHATATNASGSGAASAGFTRCAPVVHRRRIKPRLHFTG